MTDYAMHTLRTRYLESEYRACARWLIVSLWFNGFLLLTVVGLFIALAYGV